MSLNLIAVMEKQLGSVLQYLWNENEQSEREYGNARQIDMPSEMCCFFHVITASG